MADIEKLKAEIKEYTPAGSDKVMIWVNDRDTTKGGYCIECVPRHIATTICKALSCPEVKNLKREVLQFFEEDQLAFAIQTDPEGMTTEAQAVCDTIDYLHAHGFLTAQMGEKCPDCGADMMLACTALNDAAHSPPADDLEIERLRDKRMIEIALETHDPELRTSIGEQKSDDLEAMLRKAPDMHIAFQRLYEPDGWDCIIGFDKYFGGGDTPTEALRAALEKAGV